MITAAPTGRKARALTPTVPAVVARLGLGPTDGEKTADLPKRLAARGVSARAPAAQDVSAFPLVKRDREAPAAGAALRQKAFSSD